MPAQAVGDHTSIVGLHKWSDQGGVEMFHTHVCVNVGLWVWLLLTTPLFSRLPCS